jgi:nitroimidazol reductase NimA-like FMN-containing flavoprotein (pyridoxamine 5'-phosphate oxidase superfamily)
MGEDRIVEVLDGPLQAVLSVGREGKGPVAVPMSYRYVDGRFVFATSRATLHGKLMLRRGRATITVQYEECDGRTVHQWYVMAEGPVRFTDENPLPHVRAIMAKDRGAEHADEWIGPSVPAGVEIAELVPDRISGWEYRDSLDDRR